MKAMESVNHMIRLGVKSTCTWALKSLLLKG